MSCPANPKKFWIFKWEGPCNMKPYYIRASAFAGDYHVDNECTLCKARDHTSFVEAQRLIRQGFDAEKLAAMSFHDTFGKHSKDLKREL